LTTETVNTRNEFVIFVLEQSRNELRTSTEQFSSDKAIIPVDLTAKIRDPLQTIVTHSINKLQTHIQHSSSDKTVLPGDLTAESRNFL
jgi:hypothetical protein